MTPARCSVCGPDAEPHAPDSHGAPATPPSCTHVRAAALAEFDRALDAALAEYERAIAPALAEYERAIAAAWDEYERARTAGVVCNTCGGSGVTAR